MSALADAADTVQTSAPAPAPLPTPDAILAMRGRLAHKAHTASEIDRTGHTHPVVVVDLDHVGPANQRLRAHVACTSHEQAEALAESLKRGTHVTVAASLSHIRLVLAGATLSIDQEPAC